MANNVSRQELEKVESEWISNPSPLLCARLADLLRQAGRLDESREVADSGLKRWRNNTSITVVIGKCYRDSGLLEKALESFAEVHSEQPQNLVALRNLAEIHFKKENWSEAVKYLEEYLFEQPGDDESREKLEEARSRKNMSSRAHFDSEEDESESENQQFPNTKRMSKVLESQGISAESTVGLSESGADSYSLEDDSFIEQSAPGSLIEFFSDEEKHDLHLKPYDGDDE